MWEVEYIYYREMDVPFITTNFVISIFRKLPRVKPDTLITYIKRMIGQPWSIRLHNATEILTSSNFSIRTNYLSDPNMIMNSFNLTENVEEELRYKMAYIRLGVAMNMCIITKLYICDQIELEPSEFVLLSNGMDIIYSYITKRFMFDGQFTLVHNPFDGTYRARICIEGSGFNKRNTATIDKQNYVLFVLLLQVCC